MTKYDFFIENIKPDLSYSGSNGLSMIILETIEGSLSIEYYLENFTIKGKEIDFNKIYRDAISKMKGVWQNFWNSLNKIYIKASQKIGQFLSSFGSNNINETIDYEWDKLDFNKLKSYIDDFGNVNRLIGFLSQTRKRRLFEFGKYNYDEKLDIATYLDLMSSQSIKGIFVGNLSDTYDELKHHFVTKAKTISISKLELQKMFKTDIEKTMDILITKIKKNQSEFIKWIDEEVSDNEKKYYDSDDYYKKDDYDRFIFEVKDYFKRIDDAVQTSIAGDCKFMDLMFKLIAFGFNQYIKATIIGIKTLKINKSKVQYRVQNSNLLAAPRI